MTLNFNVNVTLGVTPQLERLTRLLLPAHTSGMAGAVEACDNATALVEQATEAVQMANDLIEQGIKARCAEAATTEEAAPEAPQPATTTTAPPPTEADIRSAIERARLRIQGDDYKENAESDGNKKYKRKLTAYLKGLSVALGADKPSLIAPENRQTFIERCDAIWVNNAGEMTEELPF